MVELRVNFMVLDARTLDCFAHTAAVTVPEVGQKAALPV